MHNTIIRAAGRREARSWFSSALWVRVAYAPKKKRTTPTTSLEPTQSAPQQIVVNKWQNYPSVTLIIPNTYQTYNKADSNKYYVEQSKTELMYVRRWHFSQNDIWLWYICFYCHVKFYMLAFCKCCQFWSSNIYVENGIFETCFWQSALGKMTAWDIR